MKILCMILFMCACECVKLKEHCPNAKTPASAIRKRRHLTFPTGTSLLMTISLAKSFLTHAPSGWNLVMELDFIFSLPDSNFTIAHSRRKLHHRQKREFWTKLENSLDYYNINGRACVLRSICEAKSYLAPPGKSLVHDILRSIFTAPIEEEEFRKEVGEVYSDLLEPEFCQYINECPLSIVNFIIPNNPN